MISDALLRNAAAISCSFYTDKTEEQASCVSKHNFSFAFESKIKKLNIKAKHILVYRSLMRAACVFLVLLFGSGVWLAFDAQARNVIGEWIKKNAGAYTKYELEHDPNKVYSDGVVYYTIAYMPNGYALDHEYSRQTGAAGDIAYVCKDNNSILWFHYRRFYADDLFVQTSNAQSEKVMVHNCPADYFTDADGQDTNTIVWGADETLFIISGDFDKNELIKIAQSVKPTDKPFSQK